MQAVRLPAIYSAGFQGAPCFTLYKSYVAPPELMPPRGQALGDN